MTETQYLTTRVGRNRALEIVLGGDLLDAETAERYGWISRAVQSAAPLPRLAASARFAIAALSITPLLAAETSHLAPLDALSESLLLRRSRAGRISVSSPTTSGASSCCSWAAAAM